MDPFVCHNECVIKVANDFPVARDTQLTLKVRLNGEFQKGQQQNNMNRDFVNL